MRVLHALALAAAAAAQNKSAWFAMPEGAHEDCSGIDDHRHDLNPDTRACENIFEGGRCRVDEILEWIKAGALNGERDRWNKICRSDFKAAPPEVCVPDDNDDDGGGFMLDANLTTWEHEAWPLTGTMRVLTALLEGERGVCECFGGEMVEDGHGIDGNCSIDISCIWEPHGCYRSASYLTSNGANITCNQTEVCAKHVSNVRGLFVGLAVEHNKRFLTGRDDEECVSVWQRCLFRTDVCRSRLCYTAGEDECDFHQYCQYASAAAGGLAPGLASVIAAAVVGVGLLWAA
eukprot:TRINITY_DN9032_c0_g1_i1.p1 TRINITY_DN9032_c0_g1~~TRINITY_DN9032_c0_g1_i1.p1  ORF type:complete len:290 (+),score=66.89 TRINITY_DN9032_c0_g1_i1:95-964(+)